VPLSSSILETVYDSSASLSSFVASAILFSSIVLYLPVGYIIDRLPFNGIFYFVIMSASLTLLSLIMLWTSFLSSEFLAILPYSIGYGYSPLITVLSASRIVRKDQVALALGVHKGLEMAGATIVSVPSLRHIRKLTIEWQPRDGGLDPPLARREGSHIQRHPALRPD
jgi:MFS family permease